MCASRKAVDFPDPECPVRKANCPLTKWKDTCLRAGSGRAYSFVTSMNLITRGSQPRKLMFYNDLRVSSGSKTKSYAWAANVSRRLEANRDAIRIAVCIDDGSAVPVPTMSKAVP